MVHRFPVAPWVVGPLLVLFLGTNPAPAGLRRADREPPILLRVTLGGHTQLVGSGEEFGAAAGGQAIKGRASLMGVRTFQNVDGIVFPYPRTFSYAYTGRPLHSWAMRGQRCIIRLTKLPVAMRAPQELARAERSRRLMDSKVKIENGTPLTLGSRKPVGLRIVHPGYDTEDLAVFEGPLGLYELSLSALFTRNGHVSSDAALARRLLGEDFSFPTDQAMTVEQEPAASVSLVLAKHAEIVPVDEKVVVPVAGSSIQVKVSALPVRRFENAGGLRFQYPESFEFKYAHQLQEDTWKLSGRGCWVTLTRRKKRAGEGVDAAAFMSQWVKSWSKMHPKAKFDAASPLRLDGKSLPSVNVQEPWSGGMRRMDYAAFEGDDSFYTLMVSAILDPKGRPYPDTAEVLRRLAETLELASH